MHGGHDRTAACQLRTFARHHTIQGNEAKYRASYIMNKLTRFHCLILCIIHLKSIIGLLLVNFALFLTILQFKVTKGNKERVIFLISSIDSAFSFFT